MHSNIIIYYRCCHLNLSTINLWLTLFHTNSVIQNGIVRFIQNAFFGFFLHKAKILTLIGKVGMVNNNPDGPIGLFG